MLELHALVLSLKTAFGFIFYFETGSPYLVLASLELKGTFLPSLSLQDLFMFCQGKLTEVVSASQGLGLQAQAT